VAGLFGCASNRTADGTVDPQAAVARASANNLQAVAAHQMRMQAVDSAMTLGAVAPQIAGPLGSRLQQKAHEASYEKMIDDSLRDLTPEQRALVKKHMRGEISGEEFQRQLLAPYGIDPEENPARDEH
jgi:hypothetical protein